MFRKMYILQYFSEIRIPGKPPQKNETFPPHPLFFSFPFIALPILAVLFPGVESQEVYGKYRNKGHQ